MQSPHTVPLSAAFPHRSQKPVALRLSGMRTSRFRAARFRLCVSRVAGAFQALSPLAAQYSCASHSAIGTTALAHCWLVSARMAVYDAIRRQFPSLCSKNHSRLSFWFAIKSNTKASTCGRIGSIRSNDRLSRRLDSICKTPMPGSSPSAAAASRDSAPIHYPVTVVAAIFNEFLMQAVNGRRKSGGNTFYEIATHRG